MSTQSKPTKRELREERRAARLEAERAEAAAAARRTRTWRLLAALGLAVVVVAIAAAVSSSGGGEQEAAPPAASQEAARLFAGIPEKDGVLGQADAPVILTEFVDLQCPVCAQASQETLPAIIDKYVRTGEVKLDARTLHFIGPDSERAALVAAGAAEQGRLWPFLEAFYAAQGEENSGYVTDEFLRGVARAAGVDADEALAYAATPAARERLNRANRDAQALGVNATPTFTAAKGDGVQRVIAGGNHDVASVSRALDQELQG